MHVLVVPYALLTLVGAVVLAVSSYVILSGPFGSGPLVGMDVLIGAAIAAMAGLLLCAYGATKTARLVLGY